MNLEVPDATLLKTGRDMKSCSARDDDVTDSGRPREVKAENMKREAPLNVKWDPGPPGKFFGGSRP